MRVKDVPRETKIKIRNLADRGVSLNDIVTITGIPKRTAQTIKEQYDRDEFRELWNNACEPFRRIADATGRHYVYDEETKTCTMIKDKKRKGGKRF